VAAYSDLRDRPAHSGTSRLSAHLVFGEISPHRLLLLAGGPHAPSAEAWIRQLVWRDFAWHLLYHYPHTVSQPLKEEFGRFPIRGVEPGRIAWEKGKTGYPIVDAGMRELWTTGWMHNRVRMIVASFLIKDLFIPWQDGARWFRDTLVDADLANNTLGWQWVAGCGADAAPYFRIFNPVSQSEKFDPDGHYLRRWLPELSGLSGKLIHQPWLAGSLKPKGYPSPIVNHAEAREQALEAYQIMRQGAR
jgi:deoxyribodipyrimidine photo-lyase